MTTRGKDFARHRDSPGERVSRALAAGGEFNHDALERARPARTGAQVRSSGCGVPHGVSQRRSGGGIGPRGRWRVESFLQLQSAARSLTRAIGACGSDLRQLRRSFQNQHGCQARFKAHGALCGKMSRSLSPSARGQGTCSVTACRGCPASLRRCGPARWGWGSQNLGLERTSGQHTPFAFQASARGV